MKKYLTILLLCSLSVRAEIELSGIFITSKEAPFALTDTEGHHSSGWLKLGESFAGYTLLSFDREHDTITLSRNEQMLKIPLRKPKVKEGKAKVTGTLKFRNESIEGARASLFFGEEASFPLKKGITFRIKPEQLSDGNILYHSKFVGIREDGAEQILCDLSVVAIPGEPFGIQMGDYGYSLKP